MLKDEARLLISCHLHGPEVENCDSNLRLVVNEDYNGMFRLERVKSDVQLKCYFM